MRRGRFGSVFDNEPENASGSSQFELKINPDEGLESIRSKIDLMNEFNKINHINSDLRSRRKMLSICFYVLLIFMIVMMGWATYVYIFSDNKIAILKADFIFSTLASAAVASMIGLITTFPPNR